MQLRHGAERRRRTRSSVAARLRCRRAAASAATAGREEVGARRLDAAGGGARQRMAADERGAAPAAPRAAATIARLVLPTSVTSARRGRAPADRCSSRDVLQHRRGEHDQVGARRRCARSSPPSSTTCSPQRGLDARAGRSTATMRDRRPAPLDGQRDRSADQPEADDRDASITVGRLGTSDSPASPRHRLEADAAADRRRDDPQLRHQAIELRREERLRAVAAARDRDRSAPR